MNFTGKTILITGSTSGIGKEIAKEFLENGANAVINYIHEEHREETEKEFAAYNDRCLYVKADVTDEEQVIGMMKQVEARFGCLDYLVNNVGGAFRGRIDEQNIADAERIIRLNLTSKMIVSKYAVPLMRKAGGGSIINTSSRFALRPAEGHAAYGSCEAAILMLTKVMALELAPDHIRVNTVCPGRTVSHERAANPTPDVAYYAKNAPLGRVGYTTDVAKAVMFLAGDDSSNMTGEELHINGGILLK